MILFSPHFFAPSVLCVWKRTVNKSVYSKESQLWSERIHSDSDFTFFKVLHTEIKPAIIFQVSNEHSFLQSVDIITRIWTRRLILEENVCVYCNVLYTDPICHILSNCNNTKQLKAEFKQSLLQNFDNTIVNSIVNLNDNLFMLKVLGADVGIYLDRELHILFLKESFKFVAKCKRQYDKMF